MGSKNIKRLTSDLKKFHEDPPQDIYLEADENNIQSLHALIIGPKGTPYEGGFFYFQLNIPDGYPYSPPIVKFMTTGNGAVRFNPNLYNCGKVCLSILGTWSGPGWTALMNLSTVLISIQSLLNEEPYYNEPGYENQKNDLMSQQYNKNVRFNTIRFAVRDILEKGMKMPSKLFTVAKNHFVTNFSLYLTFCQRDLSTTAEITKLQTLYNDLSAN